MIAYIILAVLVILALVAVDLDGRWIQVPSFQTVEVRGGPYKWSTSESNEPIYSGLTSVKYGSREGSYSHTDGLIDWGDGEKWYLVHGTNNLFTWRFITDLLDTNTRWADTAGHHILELNMDGNALLDDEILRWEYNPASNIVTLTSILGHTFELKRRGDKLGDYIRLAS